MQTSLLARLGAYFALEDAPNLRERVYEALCLVSALITFLVIIPVNAQVLAPYVPLRTGEDKQQFDEVMSLCVANFDTMTDFVKAELESRGFEVLLLAPELKEQIKTKKLYWPGDTHLTPEGNQLAAEAIAERFK